MSREVKFRAWDEIGEWMGDVTSIDFDERAIFMTTRCIDDENCFELDKTPVMQYTGLKDKNGKEIYEGDIVDYLGDIELANSNVLRVIEYKDEEACFVARLPIGDYQSDEAVYLNEHDFVVVDNIYENPELLEETA